MYTIFLLSTSKIFMLKTSQAIVKRKKYQTQIGKGNLQKHTSKKTLRINEISYFHSFKLFSRMFSHGKEYKHFFNEHTKHHI